MGSLSVSSKPLRGPHGAGFSSLTRPKPYAISKPSRGTTWKGSKTTGRASTAYVLTTNGAFALSGAKVTRMRLRLSITTENGMNERLS
jgi:hypothetical protein